MARSNDDKWLRTGRREDVIASLHHCARCLVWVDKDAHEWKWALLAAWCALQGALVETLRQFDGSGIFKERDEKRLRGWLYGADRAGGAYPEPFLAPLPELVKRATSGKQSSLSLSDGQRQAIERLHNEFRNEFMHMNVGGWSIELKELPAILLEVLSAVQQLVSGARFQRHLSENEREQLVLAVEQVQRIAKGLSSQHSFSE